ncbi:S41 family peptidase [Abyssalbus ytuae]|uniref:S41 family peptidase n=1 Tax=Abyssalbus ytuae TaxID=2926907 RepID=A0A9E7D2J0_9FLAO|nr:S41 family peptidase [Abyssalbus ytuae]UOB18218.1 S41 family peptidase [Abyssalbus ytuae]
MKKSKIIFLILLLSFSCTDKDDNIYIPSANKEYVVQDFIWKSMNIWYYWKNDAANLGDNRFSNNKQYNDFLSSYPAPEDFFYDGILVEEDRFSYITDDYNTLFNSQQGIFKTNGIEYGLYRIGEGNDVAGVIRYIMPNSDASTKNVKRGDIFYAVNGVSLYSNRENPNDNNLSLVREDVVTLSFATIEDNTIIPNNIEIEFTRSEYTENPVFISKVIEQTNTKIGYLMYNGFTSPFDAELNSSIGELKSQGITYLILDLRYNPGGSVRTSTYLASMITGQFNGSLYSRLRYNNFWQDYFGNENLSYNFTDKINNGQTNEPINSLNLNNVYMLTSSGTASASELLINGLKPYINVVQVGDTTVGKNQASIILLDDPRGDYASSLPYSGKKIENANPLHTYALQPIVSKTENSAGFSGYEKGLSPDFYIKENITQLGVLGDENEPLLSKAIEQITGISSKSTLKKSEVKSQFITDSKTDLPTTNHMYVD